MRFALVSASSAALLAFAPVTFAQLQLNEIGGTQTPANYSVQPGSTAFAKDLIGNGAYAPTHTTANVNNGTYGNGSSWIGDSANSFVGVSFGAAPVSVGQVAWGRDNTGTYGDRTAGLYTLEYTTDPNPNASTSNWLPIGSVTYPFAGAANSPISMSLRHLWSFPQVNATGIRLTTPGDGLGSGAAIDELEAYAYAAPPLVLQQTGGTMHAGNIAMAGMAFAKDDLAVGPHNIPNLNDGLYGNNDSWIGNSESSFAGIAFAGGAQTINGIAFGRDNTGQYADRAAGNYLLQYTTDANPGALTPDGSWTTIGPVFLDPNDAQRALRHEYAFAPVTATGIRLFTPGNGINTGAAIDELEVYAVPEPTAAALVAVAGLVGLRRRRR